MECIVTNGILIGHTLFSSAILNLLLVHFGPIQKILVSFCRLYGVFYDFLFLFK